MPIPTDVKKELSAVSIYGMACAYRMSRPGTNSLPTTFTRPTIITCTPIERTTTQRYFLARRCSLSRGCRCAEPPNLPVTAPPRVADRHRSLRKMDWLSALVGALWRAGPPSSMSLFDSERGVTFTTSVCVAMMPLLIDPLSSRVSLNKPDYLSLVLRYIARQLLMLLLAPAPSQMYCRQLHPLAWTDNKRQQPSPRPLIGSSNESIMIAASGPAMRVHGQSPVVQSDLGPRIR